MGKIFRNKELALRLCCYLSCQRAELAGQLSLSLRELSRRCGLMSRAFLTEGPTIFRWRLTDLSLALITNQKYRLPMTRFPGDLRCYRQREKERAAMLNKTICFSLILSIASVALGQKKGHPSPATETVEAPSPQATQSCQVTYSSGTSATATQFCVTVNGNIPQFSVRGTQLFAPTGNAGDLEGYGFCDVTGGQRYYDYAAYDNDLWNASTLKQTGNTVTVTRTTKDGNWQLTQTIVNVPASAGATGSAKVTMKLKNLTSVARAAQIVRYAAENVTFGNNNTNIYNTTARSASGQLEGLAGLIITANTFPHDFDVAGYVQNIQSGPDPCSPFNNLDLNLPFVGLGSIVAIWQNSEIKTAPGAVLTVTSTYKSF